MMRESDPEFVQRMESIEQIVEQLQQLPYPVGRELAQQLTQAILDLHAVGMAKMIDLVPSGETREQILDSWANDRLVHSLLALHGLHPRDRDGRVRDAVERLGAKLAGIAGELELLAVTEVEARVRLSGVTASTSEHARRIVLDTLEEAAPELHVAVEVVAGDEDSQSSPWLPVLNSPPGGLGR